MATHPVRYRLPVSYCTEIGRIITRWAYLEALLTSIAYVILDISQKHGRIAVREPRAVDSLTMIQDLMYLESLKTTVDLKALRTTLGEAEAFRDRLAHGVWVKHSNSKLPVLQIVKGSYPPNPGARSIKARIEPRGLEVDLQHLRKAERVISSAVTTLHQLRRELEAQCSS